MQEEILDQISSDQFKDALENSLRGLNIEDVVGFVFCADGLYLIYQEEFGADDDVLDEMVQSDLVGRRFMESAVDVLNRLNQKTAATMLLKEWTE